MRNKNAGKHPSYNARGMSKASRDKKKKYDKKFSSSTEQKKNRAECNKKRSEAKKNGKNILGRDWDHAANGGKGGFVKTSTNRGRKEKSRLKGAKKRK